MFALPSLWGIQNSPGKKKLQDLLPDELYERWSVLKELYIGSDRKIEKHRPIFAAGELYAKAIDKSGLESDSDVHNTIGKLIKRYKIPTTETHITRSIDNPRALLKDFKRSSIDDIACFRKTVERLEIDLVAMKSRALAWSSGDMAALRALPFEDQSVSCFEAVLNSSFGSEFAADSGLADIEEQLKHNWLEAAKNALDNNSVSFAVLPIAQLLRPDGYIAYFRNNGYQIKGDVGRDVVGRHRAIRGDRLDLNVARSRHAVVAQDRAAQHEAERQREVLGLSRRARNGPREALNRQSRAARSFELENNRPLLDVAFALDLAHDTSWVFQEILH